MDFKEWFKKEYPEVNKDADDLILGARPMRHMAEMGYKAGQQSKQAEIDALQKRIDEALNVFKSDLSEIGKFDTIHKLLKGEQK